MTARLRPSLTLALSSGQQEFLKVVAVGTMILDHVNRLLYVSAVPAFTLIGRSAFPLFAFLVAYNIACRGVTPRRYFLPLLVTGAVSQFFYVQAFGVSQLNILFTLLASTLSLELYLVLRRQGMGRSGAVAMAAAPLTTFGPFCEYGVAGTLLPCLFYAWLKRPNSKSTALMLLGVLAANRFSPLAPFGLLAVALLFAVRAQPMTLPRLPRWFFYTVYPGHIALLWLVTSLAK